MVYYSYGASDMTQITEFAMDDARTAGVVRRRQRKEEYDIEVDVRLIVRQGAYAGRKLCTACNGVYWFSGTVRAETIARVWGRECRCLAIAE